MKAIPIEYIQEFIDAWDDCKDDPEVRGGKCLRISYIVLLEEMH